MKGTTHPIQAQTVHPGRSVSHWITAANRAMTRIPEDFIALIGRFSIAAVFWKSGQTKIEGFSLDLVDRSLTLGWPRLSDSAVFLFREEYRLPVLSPELAATLAALAEHALPVLILLGLGTRLAALGLLTMTAVIQLFVYPDAYPTHGVWAALLLYLMVRGPGRVSLDAYIRRSWHS
ncbi:DoxX family protein [Thiorhodococcus minor]|uniref:DoxX family protein n=1 Tax=Thiorhodococcus minor TaxID=57489 RepID=A0A6M0K0T0_9GAMM|nr:DoxX family protein [Thiorhodococcus minor]NEV63350.1 DoxX family protein [Thiorhodococcus minor]